MKDAINKPSIAVGVLALLLLVAIGAWLINIYVDAERERDLLEWESRLGLVADAKAESVEGLLAGYVAALDELAANASLQLYLWQYVQARDEPGAVPADSPQQGYLRNLLLAAAERSGYLQADAATIPADVPQQRSAGLALLDAGLQPVVATPGMGELATAYRDAAQRALDEPKAAPVIVDEQGRTLVVLAVPVKAVIGAASDATQRPVGVIVGVRPAEQELFPMLRRGPSFAEDSEALLLAAAGDSVAYLSPTRDGTAPLRRSLPLDRPDLAEAAAVREPGGYVLLANYRGRDVLQVSRQIRRQPWVLAQQVDATQALSVANQRRGFLVTVLSLVLLSIVALALAAWRHGSSLRAQQHAGELEDKARTLQRQTDLLNTITDNIDVLTLLVSRESTVAFANRAAAKAMQVSRDEIVGGNIRTVFGQDLGRELSAGIEQAGAGGEASHRVLALPSGEDSRSYQASFIPVERIGEHEQPTLIVLSDVTDLRRAERRHAELLRRLITTLVHAVDLHDPHSANHATRLTQVADAVARELGMSGEEIESLDLAATLANIGKIMIPGELLTKAGPLDDDERRLMQRHVEFALDLLKDVEFDGPVREIIAQKQELLDGSGYPHGLGADQMTLAGRILSVANAFVALISIRAHRQGIPVREALDELMKQAGTRYDRRVIAALFHVAENRSDW
jgi:HD-GYP domain-containing protein (c-di-GMP phosphodiesterase class II)